MNNQVSMVREQYEEAFSYLNTSGLCNPRKAYCIFKKLSDEGFSVASFYCGIMMCMGIGTEKDVDKGKKMLKDHEYLGYKTEIVMESMGLVKSLTPSEQFDYISYCKNNHQIAHALFLECNRSVE